MSLKIRLSRGGAKKRPFYRIVVAESRFARDGRYVEKIGTYDPMLGKDDPKRVGLNLDRIKHWLKIGALPTDRLARELSKLGLVPAPVRREQTKQSLPRTKAQERTKAADAAAAKAAEA
jgi:small subunit ribosomal protein S16